MTNDPYEKHREAIRARGHGVNPWRLGCEVGRSGEELPNPYPPMRGRNGGHFQFAQGVKHGRLQFKARAL